MIRCLFCFAVLLMGLGKAAAQQHIQLLHKSWQFAEQGSNLWRPASVPGTIHTDLMKQQVIPDPYFRSNEKAVQWVADKNWVYKTQFTSSAAQRNQQHTDLVFDGLDTYADVYLNGQLLLQANNMFRQWRIPVKHLLKASNELRIVFHSAKKQVTAFAKADSPLVIPAENPRVYARKAQYHFGWDWGPTFVTAGIWKNVYLDSYNQPAAEKPFHNPRKIELVQEPDSIGKSFYFKIDGQPVYMKGANYIPSDMFLPRLTKNDYRQILLAAKNANMNMLRIWGGGVYETEDFYDLCDSLDIYVWQDFMFAGGMVPLDDAFFLNVKEEVIQQVKRLRHHKSIIVWCGNNEVEEAWHNWGWQTQFNLHGQDSAKVWHAYKRLFKDSIPAWLQQYDGTRPYVSTSPMHGWGRAASITEGDSHYWGIWWGMQEIEVFEKKTGRFVSEYGMMAMPNMTTTASVTLPQDRYLYSEALKTHQKHPTGFQNMNGYLHQYFMDSARIKHLSLEQYTYLTQCLQYYAFKNSIAIHRSKYPVNMGTLLWQLNDCWPVASWAITDYSRQPKAAWYAVKEAYRDDVLPQRDAVRPKALQLSQPNFTLQWKNADTLLLKSSVPAKYVYLHVPGINLQLSDNYFDLQPGDTKAISIKGLPVSQRKALRIWSLYDVVKEK